MRPLIAMIVAGSFLGLAGCAEPAPMTVPEVGATLPDPPRRFEQSFELEVIEVTTPASGNVRGTNCVFLVADLRIFHGWANATWTATSPLTEELSLQFGQQLDLYAKSGDGPSPLGIGFEDIRGAADAPYDWLIQHDTAGVSANQPVRLDLVLLYDGPESLEPEVGRCASG